MWLPCQLWPICSLNPWFPTNGRKFKYSGGRMRFYGKNVSFCVSTTTESMKTNNIQLKSPIKLPPEMQKKFWIFQNLLVFRAFFEKAVVLGNGQIWNQSIFLNETFRRASSLRFNKNGGIVDERCPHLMPATPIFPKHWFFKKGPKNQQILKNSKFFLAFLVAIL